jgi:diguanylate cyclase (GGDEF)-like protein
MKIDATFLRSKVARRIFMLFIVSALVPIFALAMLSFRQVTGHFNQQTHKHLHQAGKSVGMAIFERLLALEAELQLTAAYLRSNSRVSIEHVGKSFAERIRQRFNGIAMMTVGTTPVTLLGSISQVPALTEAERAHIASGKSALSTLYENGQPPRLFMLTAFDPGDPSRGVLVGEINTTYLWDVRYTLTLATELCVLDALNHPLYCSRTAPAVFTERARQTHSRSDETPQTWRWGDEEYLVSYWSVFLEANYLTPKWTVVVGESRSYISSAIADFKMIFPAVTLMSILLVLILSISQIRRSLVPLENLRDSTRKIANREFDSRVTVKSGDEFEELANSFNTMAFRLGRQFNVLSTMAEIDRLILSALDARNIIKTVLLRMRDIVLCDMVSVTLIESDSANAVRTFYGVNSTGELLVYETELLADDVRALHDSTDHLVIEQQGHTPDYVLPLTKQGAESYLLLPIFLDESLSAVITLGFQGKPRCSEEDLTQARRLADRVAVALSNASWEEKLYHQAHYDGLTDLPNRVLLKDRLPQALVRAERNGSSVAVLFLDLDRFKSINDSLGHAVGDLFLKEIVHRLTHCVRSVDTVARLGGDEFTIIIPDLDPAHDIMTNLTVIADKILASVCQPFVLSGHEVSATASVGIALYPRDGKSFDDLLKNADSAMYHAKAMGRSNYQFYSRELNAAAVERLDMENSLRHSLENGELELYYHPLVDIDSGRIVGAEALLRWWHPEKGLVYPDKFIPLAEQTGLIVPIGEWVLHTACLQNKAWREAGYAPVRISVNLSARQFLDQYLVEKISRILTETRLDADGLALEITEGIVMEDVDLTIKTLRDLRAMGLYLAIDDFGKGYSSFSYLKRFPINALKIDRYFVRDITTDPYDSAIVATITALGHSLNLKVIAEGVETNEQLEVLRARNCNEFQGHLISKPLPAREFQALLERDEQVVHTIEAKTRLA